MTSFSPSSFFDNAYFDSSSDSSFIPTAAEARLLREDHALEAKTLASFTEQETKQALSDRHYVVTDYIEKIPLDVDCIRSIVLNQEQQKVLADWQSKIKEQAIFAFHSSFGKRRVFLSPQGHAIAINTRDLNSTSSTKQFGLALDLKTGRNYASLKVVVKSKEEAAKIISNELQKNEQLSHVAAKIHLVFQFQSKHHYICRLIAELGDLGTFRLFSLKVKPDFHQARIIFKQLLENLVEFEKKGLIHRDIKPENIVFISSQSSVPFKAKFIDLEACCHVNDQVNTHNTTPYYVPPKYAQAYSNQKDLTPFINTKLDVWSLGMVLLEFYHFIIGREVWPIIFPSDSPYRFGRGLRFYKVKSMHRHFQKVEKYDKLVVKLLKKMLIVTDAKRGSASEVLNLYQDLIKQPKYKL